MDTETSTNSIRYIAPNEALVHQLVKEECQTLARNLGDEHFNDPEVVSGLSCWLSYVYQLVAKYRNQGHTGLVE